MCNYRFFTGQGFQKFDKLKYLKKKPPLKIDVPILKLKLGT